MADVTNAEQFDQDYSEFFQSHFAKLTAYVRVRGANPLLAEDLAQEAMLELYKKWETVTMPAAYVRTIARNLLFKEFSKSKDYTEQDLADIEFGDPHDTEMIVDANWVEPQLVVSVLLTLPPEQRLVMALKTDGYTVPEIAETLSLNSDTVRSNLRHARTALKRAIQRTQAADMEDTRWTSAMT